MPNSGEIRAASTSSYARVFEGLVAAVQRHPWPVLVLALLITAASATYTVRNFAINTDTADLISNELPFRQDYLKYKEAFPGFANTLVIVVDGENADAVNRAAGKLAARLSKGNPHIRSVFYPRGDPYFRSNGLLYLGLDELRALSDRLAEAQPLLTSLAADMSLRGLFDVLALALGEAAKGGFDVSALDPILRETGAAVDARLAGQSYQLSWSGLLRGKEPTLEDRRRIIVAQAISDWRALKPDRAVMEAVRAEARDLGITPENGLRLRLTGSPALDTEELESVEEGAGAAGLLTLFLVLSLLLLGLRSLRLVAATLITLFAGLICTAGFAILAVGELNMISMAFAVLFIGLGVDFGIHLALRYDENRRAGVGEKAALLAAVRGVSEPLSLSAVCAAIAFFAFVPTAYRGVAELGLISGVGMFIALIANFTLLPALLAVIPARPAGGGSRAGRDLAGAVSRGLGHAIDRYGTPIVYSAALLGAVGLVFASQIKFDFDPLNLKDPNKESVQAVRELGQNPRYTMDTLSILTPDLDAAVALAKKVKALPEVRMALTLREYVPKDQDEKLPVVESMALFMTPLLIGAESRAAPTAQENRDALAAFRRALETFAASPQASRMATDVAALADKITRFEARLDGAGTARDADLAALQDGLLKYLPDQLDALRQSLEAGPVTADDLPPALRARQMASDGRARIKVFPAQSLSENEERRRFVEAVKRVAPNATDASVLLLESADAITGAFLQATATTLVLVLLLLAVLLRNIWDVVLVMAPLALAAVYTLAVAELLGMSLNFANIIALPLLMGLGVASAIHLVMRARQAAADGGNSLLRTSTPRAVLFSALTTIGSFGSLAISSHRGTASMGELLILALGMTLLCALVLLPALMRVRDQYRAGRRAPAHDAQAGA